MSTAASCTPSPVIHVGGILPKEFYDHITTATAQCFPGLPAHDITACLASAPKPVRSAQASSQKVSVREAGETVHRDDSSGPVVQLSAVSKNKTESGKFAFIAVFQEAE